MYAAKKEICRECQDWTTACTRLLFARAPPKMAPAHGLRQGVEWRGNIAGDSVVYEVSRGFAHGFNRVTSGEICRCSFIVIMRN